MKLSIFSFAASHLLLVPLSLSLIFDCSAASVTCYVLCPGTWFVKFAVKLISFGNSKHLLRINDMIIPYRMEQKVGTFDGVEMGASRPGRVYANYYFMPFAFN